MVCKSGEKDNISKKKKTLVVPQTTQVSTRTHKSATKTKKMDMHTGNNSEKFYKTKKSYRKIEVVAHFLNDPVNDEEPVTKKEKENRKQIKK